MKKPTYVGLDVHACSENGYVIDRETCQIPRQRLAAKEVGIAV